MEYQSDKADRFFTKLVTGLAPRSEDKTGCNGQHSAGLPLSTQTGSRGPLLSQAVSLLTTVPIGRCYLPLAEAHK